MFQTPYEDLLQPTFPRRILFLWHFKLYVHTRGFLVYSHTRDHVRYERLCDGKSRAHSVAAINNAPLDTQEKVNVIESAWSFLKVDSHFAMSLRI